MEYITDQLDLDPLDPMYRTFSKIFQAFKIVDPEEEKKLQAEEVRPPVLLSRDDATIRYPEPASHGRALI